MSNDKRGRACVVVLGDIGRSPRMQYHALSLANQANFEVDIVGYGEASTPSGTAKVLKFPISKNKMRPVNLNLTLGRGAEEERVQNTHQNQANVNVNQLAYNHWRNNLRQLNWNSVVNTRAQMNIPQPKSYTTFFTSPLTPTPVASPPPLARTYGNYDHLSLLSSVNLNMNRERNRGASGNQWFTSPLTGEPQQLNNINNSNTVALGVPTTERYSNFVLRNQMDNGASISGSASQVATTPTPVVANATGIQNNVNIRNMMVREVGESSNGNSNNPPECNMPQLPQGNFKHYDPSKRCRECNGFDTPMWRKGPLGPKTLCNACGIKYQRKTTRDKDDNVRNQHRRS